MVYHGILLRYRVRYRCLGSGEYLEIFPKRQRETDLPIHDALDDTINVYVWLWCVELRIENPISWQRIVGASVFMNATANKPDAAGKKGATMTTTRKGAAW